MFKIIIECEYYLCLNDSHFSGSIAYEEIEQSDISNYITFQVSVC